MQQICANLTLKFVESTEIERATMQFSEEQG
jgi:hypothetical protein